MHLLALVSRAEMLSRLLVTKPDVRFRLLRLVRLSLSKCTSIAVWKTLYIVFRLASVTISNRR